MSQNQMTTTKHFKCFSCGREIIFKGTRQKFNPNGSVHVCDPNERKAYSGDKNQGSGYSSSQRQNRWYWGFGPGKYHKDNEKRYSGEEYQQRKKAAEEQRKQYREQYTTKNTMSEVTALETLGLTKEILKLHFVERLQKIKEAFRRLALRFHPDRKPEGNHEAFIEINTAYEFLTQRS